MDDFQKDGARVFKAMLKSRGFDKEQIKNIIQIVDAQPILIMKTGHVDVQSKDGVITVTRNVPESYTSLNYKDMGISALCELIVSHVGVPLPTYDYETKKYISVTSKNIRIGEGVVGIDKSESHSTFRSACLKILYDYDEIIKL